MAAGLTLEQKLFCDEYLIDLNQTRAYVAAGYSKKGAAQSASLLLRNSKVAQYVAEKSGKRLGMLDVSAGKILTELARIAFADPRKLFKSDGSPKDITELDDDAAATILDSTLLSCSMVPKATRSMCLVW